MMEDIGERRQAAGSGVTARKAWATMAVFIVCALLLNGRHIHEKARLRPYGFWWTVWVTATRPLAWASTVTRLDRPRERLEELFGQQGEAP